MTQTWLGHAHISFRTSRGSVHFYPQRCFCPLTPWDWTTVTCSWQQGCFNALINPFLKFPPLASCSQTAWDLINWCLPTKLFKDLFAQTVRNPSYHALEVWLDSLSLKLQRRQASRLCSVLVPMWVTELPWDVWATVGVLNHFTSSFGVFFFTMSKTSSIRF